MKALNIMNVQHGSMYINFGDPFSLRQILTSYKTNVSPDQPIDTKALLEAKRTQITSRVAYEVWNIFI